MQEIKLSIPIWYLCLLGICLTAQSQPFPPITITRQAGLLYGNVTINENVPDSFDWVGAYDPDGNCVGAAPVILFNNKAYLALTIYGNDPWTQEDEGMDERECFRLEFYDASKSEYIPLDTTFCEWESTFGAPMPAYRDTSTLYAFVEGGPLPIVWLNVESEIKGSGNVELQWQLEDQESIVGFDIQRRIELKGTNFSTIGHIHSSNVHNFLVKHHYLDDSLVPGFSYQYRIKAIVADGSFFFSPILNLSIPSSASFDFLKLYPNPVTREVFTLDISIDMDSWLWVVIFDLNGKMIFKFSKEFKSGIHKIPVSVSDIPAGTYWLKVYRNGNFHKSYPLIIKD